ncbi:hypothetical protein [Roseibium sp.]|uniref:hypothetical protein n=1 Tax=Roseibium sp. TaxID=1936156 RepID=UPI003D096775
MTGVSDVVATYIMAKDGNRPWLMRRAFAEGARLEMAVKTDAISFPSTVTGVDAISDTLVRRFSEEQENVYTLCLSSPPEDRRKTFSCNWLVGMSRRDNGDIRVGCGRYDWSFTDTGKLRASDLKITIEVMQILAPENLRPVMDWLSALPYPWCPARRAAETMPQPEGLSAISDFLRQCR